MHTMKNDWRCENSLVNVYDSYALGWLLFIAYPFFNFFLLFHIILHFLRSSFVHENIHGCWSLPKLFPFFSYPLYCEWVLHWIVERGKKCRRIEMNVQWNYISFEALLYNHPCIHPSFLLLYHSQKKKNFFFIVPCSFVAAASVVNVLIQKGCFTDWIKSLTLNM